MPHDLTHLDDLNEQLKSLCSRLTEAHESLTWEGPEHDPTVQAIGEAVAWVRGGQRQLEGALRRKAKV